MTVEELVAFLRARLQEEEQVALAVDSAPWWQGESDAPAWDRNLVYVDGCNERIVHDLTEEEAAHISMWDPHRVVDEIAAKRAVVDACEAASRRASGLLDVDVLGARISTELFGQAILRHFVQPYVGHPDFDPAWSTQTVEAP